MKQQRRHLEARQRQFVRRVIRGSVVLFLICALSAINLSVSRAAATASLVASPATAVQGERIGVTGSGFRAGEGIIFYWSGALLPETTTASSGGSFSNVLISIPLTATHGSHPLLARGKASGLTGVTGVTVPAPKLSAAPTSAVPGQAISVTGSGFRAGEAITFFVNGQLLPETTTASSGGSFSNVAISIPLTAAHGSHPLVARGKASGLNGIATLHVEALPSTSTPRPIVAPTQTPLATQPPAPISTPIAPSGPSLPAGLYHFAGSLVAAPGAQVSHVDGILSLQVAADGALTGSTLRLKSGAVVPVGGAGARGLLSFDADGLHLDGHSSAVSSNRISGLFTDHTGGTNGFWVATRIASGQAGARYNFTGHIVSGPDSGMTYAGSLELWGDTYGGLLGWLTLPGNTVLTLDGQSVNGNVNMLIVVRAGTPLFASGTTSGANLQGTIAGPLAGDQGTWTATK